MPTRHFDGNRIRVLRVEARLKQSDVARAVGVSDAAIGRWENGKVLPDPEKLPALAKALGYDLDLLFPLDGPPDLATLRANVGLYQADTKHITKTRSAGPVAYAERGKARLSAQFVEPLAAAYGVTVEELLAAQERSFGNEVPEERQQAAPATLSEKINSRLRDRVPPLTDSEIAAGINEYAGAQVITEAGVRALREGKQASAPLVVREGLAAVLGTERPYFQSKESVVRDLAASLKYLADSENDGKYLADNEDEGFRVQAARGLDTPGLSPEVLAIVSKAVGEVREIRSARRRPNA
ncbi:helix-turn-helix transcriptional regulator [Streptomyces sp. NPDC021100]|uniref:helix-turn-helix transcriptional regulator n=1 Tax=Streptomyces sp. NPDC021100 TaxID=3365114 RepID=UPI0037A3B7AE